MVGPVHLTGSSGSENFKRVANDAFSIWLKSTLERPTLPVLLIAILLACIFPASAQTSYSENFDGPGLGARWNSDSHYALSWDSGTLRIGINKTDRWQGLYFDLGGTYNFSANPIVNLAVRGDVPFLLHVYFVDSGGRNILVTKRVHEVGRIHDFCFDLSTASPPSGFTMSAIKAMIFAVNGNGKSLTGTAWFDNLRVGSSAVKFASMRAVPDQHRYRNTSGHSFMITDIVNATSLSLSSSKLLKNVVLSPISNGQSLLSYDCVTGTTGTETLTLTATGTTGFSSKTQTFQVVVHDNAPPTLDSVANQSVQAGITQVVRLTGISDGDSTIEQPLSFVVHSTNQTALPDSSMQVVHAEGSPFADLSITTAAAATAIGVTITLNDGQASNNTASKSFTLDSYNRLNHAPTLNPIDAQAIKLSGTARTVELTGVTDGDSGGQALTFSVTSSNPAVLPAENVVVGPVVRTSANLMLAPLAEGNTTLTVTLTDSAAGTDNGPLSVTRSFNANVIPLLPSGYIEPFSSLGNWGFSSTYSPSLSTFGGSPCVKAVCSNKYYWDGYILNFSPNLDLSENPYLSMEVYSEGTDTLHWLWFYDDANIRNINVGAMDKAQWAPAGKWTKMLFDFSGYGQMSDSQGNPINAGRITHALFNMHNQVSSWPLPANYSGTFYVRNIRVGTAAELGLVSCKLDGIPDCAVFPSSTPQVVALSGLSSGTPAQVSISATSNNRGFVPDPSVSAVSANGSAALTFHSLSGTGRTTITVTAHAAGSIDAIQTFTVDVVPASAALAQTVNLAPSQEFQTIRGFGTYQFPDRPQYAGDYTGDLGSSAVRVGFIGNQLEPDNDNNDPNVLNRAALNYNALDFEYLKALKAGGVETFILTSWTPPAWMKDNLSDSYGYASTQSWASTDNRLATNFYDEFAESMVAAVRVFKEQAGIDLYAIGLQNEPAFDEPYGSAILDPAHFVDLIKVTGSRFAREGITTKLYMPEQVFGQASYSMAQYIDAVQADSVADSFCSVIATHGYADDGIQAGQPDYSQWTTMYQNASAAPHPKELWMSETYPEGGTWDQALSLAGAMHGALTAGNVSLWTIWSIEGTLMKGGLRTPSYDAARHFSKFVRPGWKRIAATGTNADLLVSAFRSAPDYAAILINKGDASLPVQLAGTGLPSRFHARLSSRDRSFEATELASGFLMMPPRSIATLYGNTAYDSWVAGINWKGKDSGRESIVSPLGVKNLVLYALGIRDPFATDPSKLPRLTTSTGSGFAAGSNEVLFEFRKGTAGTALTFAVQQSPDLKTWSTLVPDGATVFEEIANPNPDGDGSAVLMRYRIRFDSTAPNGFVRLQITE